MMSLVLAPVGSGVGVDAEVPCRRFDPDLWFADSPAELELAKSLCVDCPVRVECLAGAAWSGRRRIGHHRNPC